MDSSKLKDFLDQLNSETPQQHAQIFAEIRSFTKERLYKESENYEIMSKELKAFIEAKLFDKS